MMFGFFYLRRDPGRFVEDRYGPTERRQRELRKRERWWRRHWAWIITQPWPLRFIIVVLDITAAYLALIVGALIGLAIRFSIGY